LLPNSSYVYLCIVLRFVDISPFPCNGRLAIFLFVLRSYFVIQEILCHSVSQLVCGSGSSVGIATGYGLGGSGIESQWGRDFPHLSRPTLGPTMRTGSFPGVKKGRGVAPTPHPLLMPWSRKRRAISLLPLWTVQPVQSLNACTVQLYLYSHYVLYSLYRASVPVQYSYTSTLPMGRTACTEPQCLYSTAISLLPLWVVQPVQSLSACTVELYLHSPYGPYGLYRRSVPVQ